MKWRVTMIQIMDLQSEHLYDNVLIFIQHQVINKDQIRCLLIKINKQDKSQNSFNFHFYYRKFRISKNKSSQPHEKFPYPQQLRYIDFSASIRATIPSESSLTVSNSHIPKHLMFVISYSMSLPSTSIFLIFKLKLQAISSSLSWFFGNLSSSIWTDMWIVFPNSVGENVKKPNRSSRAISKSLQTWVTPDLRNS